MNQYPLEAFQALDHLNSWVRAPKGFWCSSPRHAIYDWKIELIKDAIASAAANLRAIKVHLTCRDCGGSGRYMNHYGDEQPHCWRCNSSGNTTLRFLVTEIHGFIWHTPVEKTWKLYLPSDFFDSPQVCEDWEPNAPGREMEPWEVAACLNVLEPVMPKPGSIQHDHGTHDHSKYRIYLGRGPHVCEFCDTAPASDRDGSWHHVCREHIEWLAWACNECKRPFATQISVDSAGKLAPSGGNGRSIFDEFKPPVIEHAEILTWLARRERDLRAG